jgi:hypothetical protein
MMRAASVRLYLAISALLGACGSTKAPPAAPATAAACDPARDRAVIKAMAGEFDVSFEFEETDVLTPGYQRRDAYRTEASEVVEVIEDSDRKIVLQHILLVDDQPQKHWRQDWTFEDTELVEFKGDGTWERRTLPAADVTCTWSQAVYEVSDAPRYESFARWEHGADAATWTSPETWRPLPRREYTKRDDYGVLLGINRVIVRKDGWAHEQDNAKMVLADGRKLVRERGDNKYVRASLTGAPAAREYLTRTAPFWTVVRAEWQTLLAQPRLSIAFKIDGKQLFDHLFAMADQPVASAPDLQKQVHEVIGRYLRPATAAASPAPAQP